MRRLVRFSAVSHPTREAAIPSSNLPLERCALIGVDWGTSNVRVMRIAQGGVILDVRSDRRGAGELAPEAFGHVLEDIAGDWLDQAPVLICGMAGARGRWREAPYAPCPAGLDDLCAGLVRPRADRDIYIVPGVAELGEHGLVDVMRGEETQVLGLEGLDDAGWIVAPGTHSKWIRTERGRIAAFRTFATGELFAALRGGTLIASGVSSDAGEDGAFRQGVERSLMDAALSAAVFSARVAQLSGRLSARSAPDYLSGVLIGSEIAAQQGLVGASVVLVGAEDLTRRYDLALRVAGHPPARICNPIAAVALGLWRIWSSRP